MRAVTTLNLRLASIAWSLVFALGCPEPATRPDLPATVTWVMDGDSLKLEQDRRTVEVRLYGVDAPEWDQPFGPAAKARTMELAKGARVSVVEYDTDRYGRTVAEVTLADGESLNTRLVSEGLAWWYQRHAPDRRDLEDAQAEAQREGRGLWSQEAPVAPWTHRSRNRDSR